MSPAVLENCGLFGVHADRDCVEELYTGMFKLQHRGQKYCGIATQGADGIRLTTHKGFVRHTFAPEELRDLAGNSGIAHVSLKERQPVFFDSRLGPFAVAFSGNIINAATLVEGLKRRGHSFSTGGHIELIGKLIACEDDFVTGLERLASRVLGSYTVVVLTGTGIFAARDPHGFKPLVLGRKDSAFAVSSESRPFNLLGYSILRDVGPGEIVHIGKAGVRTRRVVPGRVAHCAFEWGYIASIDSVIDGIPVVRVRKNLGAALARNDAVEADIVSPIPFSGIGYALGYHQASGIPYDESFLIDRFASRSYLPLTAEEREKEARIKISVIRENVAGKRIVLCDDSIVRGTQIRHKVLELKAAGAREVHVRIGCPPLMAPCAYGISTRSYKELAAKKHSIRKIGAMIGADTLRYNTLDDFIAAIGMPADRLCLSCWTGEETIR